jgi:drug/metabolite transporter (DMT)-like permease
MNTRALRADLLLLLTAGLWGFGFVAQRSGMEYVGPFAFNGIRFILGSITLLPFILLQKTGGPRRLSKKTIRSTLAAGSCLFIAVVLQQFGIMFTTAGNAGFITGLYVVLTPIFGIFLGRKTGLPTWIGGAFTLGGLFFLSAAGRMENINPGDIITAASAVFWAFHVLLIDRLVQGTNPIVLSSGQFLWCGIFSSAAAFIFEDPLMNFVKTMGNLPASSMFRWLPFPKLIGALAAGETAFPVQALIPILYGGLVSVGIAYTLQVVAQKDAPPAHATIILCL